jgi:hypothetical protein
MQLFNTLQGKFIVHSGTSLWQIVKETQVERKTLDADFGILIVMSQALCHCQYNRPIMFRSYDGDSDDERNFLGEHITTLRRLQEGAGDAASYPLYSDRDAKRQVNSTALAFFRSNHARFL